MIRRMNYYLRDTIEKVVKVDISYSRIEADLQAANYEADLYVCLNGQLIFSNVHSADLWTPFEDISPELIQKSSDVKSLDLYTEIGITDGMAVVIICKQQTVLA